MKTSWIMSAGSSVVVVGLNAALQKRFVLPPSTKLVAGNVHRAQELQVGVGGKGQDVAIALSCLPNPGTMQLAQFVGSGPEGDAVYELLRERFDGNNKNECLSLTVRTKSHMRTCTTIVAPDVSTELVEPSGSIQKEELDELFQKIKEQPSPAAGLCIMGSMPPGCPEDTYASIYQKIHGPKTLCLIDSVVGLEQLLKTIGSSVQKGPTILKVNASELCRLAKVETSSEESAGIDPAELIDGTSSFLRKFAPYASVALDGIAVTDGKHPAHFVVVDKEENNFQIFKLSVPALESEGGTLYPIGAGDTVAAGTLAAWRYLENQDNIDGSPSGLLLDETIRSELLKSVELVRSLGPETVSLQVYRMVSAFAFGLACGSASCLEEQNSIFQVQEALKLYREMAPPMALFSVPLDAT